MQYVNTEGLSFILGRLKSYISSRTVTIEEFNTEITEIRNLVDTLLGNITEGSESDIANKLSQLNNDIENFNNIFNEFKNNNPNVLETLEGVLELQDLVMNIKSLLDIKFVGDLSDIEIDGTLNQQVPGINIEDLHEDLQNRIKKPLTIVQRNGDEINLNTEINFVESVKTNLGDPEKNNSDSLNVIVTSNKLKYKDIVNTIFSITYDELLSCINDNLLIKGMMYRIIDYVTTTSQPNTSSLEKQFDIIVTALDTNKLSEDAYVIRHDGDTYFNNQNLSKWEVKYCIYNDTLRFSWTDTENGKGVIYYMRDEYGNEAPYDFKNIKFDDAYFTFSEYKIVSINGTTGENTYGYIDASLLGYVNDNKIDKYYNDKVLSLAKNIFISRYDAIDKHISYNEIGIGCTNNTFGSGAINNKIGNNCTNNTFGEFCTNNILGYNNIGNNFGNNCSVNKLYYECQNNRFLNNCIGNILNNRCQNNELNNDNKYNVFGNNCSGNILKDNSYSNIFDSNCSRNIFDFGCNNVVFNVGCSDNEFRNDNIRISEMVLEPCCSNNIFNVKSGESSLYNIYTNMGVKELTIDELWNPYDERKIDIVNKNSKALEYCLADFIVPTNPANIDRNLYATFLFKTDGQISFTYNTDTPETEYLEYNINGNTTDWKKYTADSPSIVMGPGSEISFRGNISVKPENGIGKFNIPSGNVSLYGQLSSLVSVINQDYLFYNLFNGCTGIKNVSKDLLINIDLTQYCFKSMFRECTSLVNTPKLPKTNLKPYCYEGMFFGCTSLTNTPELPATTLASHCYGYMFSHCNNLTTVYDLPAVELAEYCYESMFYNCTSLVSAPKLPATTLASHCYSDMFRVCTSLVNAPTLPATTLADFCYANMFSSCTLLDNAPVLHATTLTSHCYADMFYGCTSLINAPELPATTLVSHCYTNMFNGCTSLNYIKALFVDEPLETYMENWVQNVAPSGIFVKNREANWDAETVLRGSNSIPEGWNIEGDIKYIDEDKRENYFTILPLHEGEVYADPLYISFNPSENTIGKLYYTTNYIDSDWKELPSNTSIIFENFGNEIKSISFKGNLNLNNSSLGPDDLGLGTLNIVTDNGNSDIRVSLNGKLASIMFEDNVTGEEILPNNCFKDLFNGVNYGEYYYSVISDVSKLILPTKLSNRCYSGMFSYCSSLVNTPVLPATTLKSGCYDSMFSNCIRLQSIPEGLLPATELATYCYTYMFYSCTGLQSIPEGLLPATTLADGCYYAMFRSCHKLTSIPEGLLPITELKNSCYASMFAHCSGLTSIPERLLPATTMLYGCYLLMFSGCNGLTEIPGGLLPATTLATSCYQRMFESCHNLTSIPEGLLPATTLSYSCYEYMFNYCTGLTSIPEGLLPATTLANNCYYCMFNNCTSLVESPKLVAQILVSNCYSGMFTNCSNLNKIWAEFTTTPSNTYTKNWVQNVAKNGTFIKNPDATWDVSGVNGVPEGWEIKLFIKPENCMTMTALEDDFTFSLNHDAEGASNETYEYSTDGSTWTTINKNTTSPEFSTGTKIYFKGNLVPNTQDNYYGIGTFETSKKFDLSGNCMSLIYGDDTLNHNDVPAYAFSSLFSNCIELFSISENFLPATTLASHCYYKMFYDCDKLDSVPAGLLPATTLADYCYSNMFYGCWAMSIPEGFLPATELASHCYERMFHNCSTLSSIPEGLLPATTLAESCYKSMFMGCTHLTTIPEGLLPATTLAESCYNRMFDNCHFLKTTPKLPATTLAESCYNSMFDSCKYITTIPELPATELADYCYYAMFRNCIKLTSIPEGLLPITELKYSCYTDMFSGCTGLTEIPEGLLPATELASYCYQGMFSGCNGLTEIPGGLLPATTLADGCYQRMFGSCHNLTSIPEGLLPATILASWCYESMFYYCHNLTSIPENLLPATELEYGCYMKMFRNCDVLKSSPKLPAENLRWAPIYKNGKIVGSQRIDRCYEEMFKDCSNLNHIEAYFLTEPSDEYMENWVSGVAPTGTFIKHQNATWDVVGTNGVPEGWTIEYTD